MKKSGSACGSGNVFTLFLVCLPGILLFLLLPGNSEGYYVGPEVGKARGETRVLKVRNVTSLAEAAYVPYINGVGNGVIEFLKSFVPALQPKVDFFAEQIQDTIDTANTKLMQKLENSNNGIIALENFFTGLMKAVVLGRGPEDDERRRRLAMALIKSGKLKDIRTIATTIVPTVAAVEKTTIPIDIMTTQKPVKRASFTTIAIPITSTDSNIIEETTSMETTTTTTHRPVLVMKDNNFNKMKVIKIVSNML